MSRQLFGDYVKGVVDVSRRIMAVHAELHADLERVLLENGSRQEDLWGINLYPNALDDEWIEYDSMINIRPRQGNRSRDVESEEIRGKIRAVVAMLVKK
ncbi:hypothetical protein HY622_02100 [Candidatus Uhrbacteria bacterium]|nr:hypothetical protein [Candidatus Uhrbacteria bacterium]